jgi:predicted alpha/beta-hydrolase family hydrolase
MTVSVTPEPFEVGGDPPVRGVLHRASGGGGDALVLTHGAGSDHRAALLATLARAFAAAGVSVARCDLPFRQARRSGPPSPREAERDRRGLAAALAALDGVALPGSGRRRFLGGHSYGGRQASMLLADSPGLADGLLLLSYPLHPPSRPQAHRSAHLPLLRVPTLFVHGTRDPFGSLEEIEAARRLVAARTALVTLAGAGHALRTDEATARDVVEAFRRLVA